VRVGRGSLRLVYFPKESTSRTDTDPYQSTATTTKAQDAPVKKEAPLDGPAFRRLIVQGLTRATEPAKPIISHGTFCDIFLNLHSS